MVAGNPPPADGNGRQANGQFAKGNAGGPGNPHGGRVALLRTTFLDAVTAEDLQAVARALLDRARSGDLAAIREVLDRTIGRPTASVNVELLDAQNRKLMLQQQRLELDEERLLFG